MKETILKALKIFGFFRLARALTAGKMRILCYHGISVDDEHRFRPPLFMTAANFRRQLEIIRRSGYPVVPLGAVDEYLRGKDVAPASVVITIDDGWYGTFRDAVPVLEEFGFPATIYVTTYYAGQRLPVFNLMVLYLFWKTRKTSVDLGEVGHGLDGVFDLTQPDRVQQAAAAVIALDGRLGPADRHALTLDLARVLDVAAGAVEGRKILMLATPEEIHESVRIPGIDIQLHTHRHRMGRMTRDEMQREIRDNRGILEPLVNNELTHFCYPSGNYNSKVWPFLQELGIKTATTSRPGLVSRQSHPFELKRVSIEDQTSDIQFEAELCGALELLRSLRSIARGGRVA